jgi:hypothetical protein
LDHWRDLDALNAAIPGPTPHGTEAAIKVIGRKAWISVLNEAGRFPSTIADFAPWYFVAGVLD